MKLVHDLSLCRAKRPYVTPWWHGFRSTSGQLPDLVLDQGAGRAHNVTFLDSRTLDLSGLDLEQGLSFFVRGRLSISLGGSDYPRLIEFGSLSGVAERQLIFVKEADGRPRFQSWAGGAEQATTTLSASAYTSMALVSAAARLTPAASAVRYEGNPLYSFQPTSFPNGADKIARAYLTSSASGAVYTGLIEQLAIWKTPLSDSDLISLA